MSFNAVIFLPCFQASNAQRRVSTFDFFFPLRRQGTGEMVAEQTEPRTDWP